MYWPYCNLISFHYVFFVVALWYAMWYLLVFSILTYHFHPYQIHLYQSGGWRLKTFSTGYCFLCILDNSRKTNGQAFAPRLYNSCPCARPAHVGESWPLAILPWGTDEIQERKYFRERSNIKALVSVLNAKQVLVPCWIWSHVTRPTTIYLIHWAMRSYQSPEKTVYDSSCLAIFGVQDCRWISRPDTIYQNSWLQTFRQYMLSHST